MQAFYLTAYGGAAGSASGVAGSAGGGSGLAGWRVLVNGASGGVGTFAVQIARALGATVSAVCGSHNADLVHSLGAEEIFDYRAADFTRAGRRFDLLIDVAGRRSGRACRSVLPRDGVLALVGGPAGRWVQPAGHAFVSLAGGAFARQRVRLVDAVASPDKGALLTELAALVKDGRVRPVIDRRYPFPELPAALRYQEAGHAPGKVIVTR